MTDRYCNHHTDSYDKLPTEFGRSEKGYLLSMKQTQVKSTLDVDA